MGNAGDRADVERGAVESKEQEQEQLHQDWRGVALLGLASVFLLSCTVYCAMTSSVGCWLPMLGRNDGERAHPVTLDFA
ncbi:hypothetical protein AURDEDRAFT_156728 [Auricularia subglabra TFB-10046 SS5]|nr:hypothetical protein AURDEDRAFT_156728 [Auricularia subglabra TFB-10046 SS5]